MTIFRFDEKYLSQIPALEQLVNMGFEYLTPAQALAARQGKTCNVLLVEILQKQLKEINRIPYKGNEYLFNEENLQLATRRLKNIKCDGLRKTNETIYERLTLGLALEQTVEGNSKSFTLRYIDWQNWRKNTFHVTAEFVVAHQRSIKILRFPIVLFVNGIPLAVIECAPPSVPIDEVVLQSIRNQRDTYTPKLFGYAQLLLAINRDDARFGTIGTPARFWSVWKEGGDSAIRKSLAESIRRISELQKRNLLFSDDFAVLREFFDARDIRGERITGQTTAIYGLCRPKRLLELIYKFTVFDNGIKKIARYQQYFAVKRILSHIRVPGIDGRRRGGIVWHTMGSGKSLTMVMLARSLAEEPGISNPRIVLVTDRRDLDKQIKDTFAACDLAPQRTKTGRDLLELVSGRKTGVITTLVHKFDKALNIRKYRDDSIDIFMLIDESHRTQFGSFAMRMRQMFPKACYLGFTGTPLMKKEKNNFAKFGGLIDRYTIDRAIQDKAIVPLLYEARHVEMRTDKSAIDQWFDHDTQGLSDTQKAALKKKYARAGWLNKTDKLLYARALDISRHFRNTLQGSGYKGQLMAPDKSTALAYHRYLNEIGLVSSEVIISPPSNREGHEKTDTESGKDSSEGRSAPKDPVVAFWREMMRCYGSEAEYNHRIINRFKHGDAPEILIVVDKLQTGFDAPCNAVLYITRALRGHTLLQAIARVNRVHEGADDRKEFGLIVDYVGILGDLDKALSRYSALEDFDEEDLRGSLVPIQEELRKLPQRYADLRALFVNARHDEEIREILSRDEAIRNTFHERLTKFGKTLDLALSNDSFIADTPAAEREIYTDDLRRFRELKKTLISCDVADTGIDYPGIDCCDYESRMKEMLNTHVSASGAVQLYRPTFISPFDVLFDDPFTHATQYRRSFGSNRTPATEAHTIAKATRQILAQHKEWDPLFYSKFSRLIQQITDEFKAKRLTDVEYLTRIRGIYIRVTKRGNRDVPIVLRNNKNAIAFYRVLKPYLSAYRAEQDLETMLLRSDDVVFDSEIITNAALAIDAILQRHWKVRFWDDTDAVKQVMNDIDDYFCDEIKEAPGIKPSLDQIDEIIEKVIKVARYLTLPSGR